MAGLGHRRSKRSAVTRTVNLHICHSIGVACICHTIVRMIRLSGIPLMARTIHVRTTAVGAMKRRALDAPECESRDGAGGSGEGHWRRRGFMTRERRVRLIVRGAILIVMASSPRRAHERSRGTTRRAAPSVGRGRGGRCGRCTPRSRAAGGGGARDSGTSRCRAHCGHGTDHRARTRGGLRALARGCGVGRAPHVRGLPHAALL